MSEKEPGQLAYEAWVPDAYPWEHTPHKSRWAAVEYTIRADEAAKVRAATIEQCAKALEAMIDKAASDRGDRADMALMDAVIAIRALGEK